MNKTTSLSSVATVLCALSFALCIITGCGGEQSRPETSGGNAQPEAVTKIDGHAHIYVDQYDEAIEPALFAMLEKNGMQWFDICTIGMSWNTLREQVRIARRLHGLNPGRVAWAVSFNIENWGSPVWQDEAIEFIGDGFANGAVAVKVWKEIGMELKDPDGSYVMIDDPRFDPILDMIERNGKTLVCHLGEPRNCWLPLEEMTVNGDRNYFRNNPQYHAWLHPEIPSYEKQIAARDNMLEKHPGLRVVGCHLASLEYDVDEIAKRLDKYPNFAVDTAARIIHFKVQDRDAVRAFCTKYQDRIIYGTDLSIRSMEGLDETFERFGRVYDEDYRYFSTDGIFTIAERDEPVRGLGLPEDVVRKIFRDNARKWYPGL